jgi:tetratricopeptide (TPR) repeat protein
VQLALAASVLLVLAGAGGWLWWADRQAVGNHRAAETALDQAEAAMRKDNPVYGEIDAALTQAERRLETGGADDLRPRYESLAKDRRMIQRLDEIDNKRWNAAEGRKGLDTEYARANFPPAFRDFGIDPERDPPDVLAARVSRSPAAGRFVAGLYAWLEVGGGAGVAAVIDELDPDPDRSALRRAITAKDADAVAKLVARMDGRSLPPAFAQLVGGHPLTPPAQALRVVRAAQSAYPNHFGLAVQTAFRSPEGQPDQAAYYRVALAIRPANVICYNHLGVALEMRRDYDGAAVALREAIRLEPRFPLPHYNLGNVLYDTKDFDGAIAAYREAIRLDPTYARPQHNLGNALHAKKDYEGAAAAYREAMRLEPNFAYARNGLGNALFGMKDYDGAAEAFHEAIRLDPNYATPHNGLAAVYKARKDTSGVIAEYREAVRLKIVWAPVYSQLAALLNGRGESFAALAVIEQGARVNPAWMADPQTGFRYNAACLAVLSAAGNAKDAPPAGEHPGLRRKALDWLTADLAAWGKLRTDPRSAPPARQSLLNWLKDDDLASVRESDGLAKLPADERAAWARFWGEVRDLVMPAEAAPTPHVAP